ncbi:serine/threonine-protein kinase Tda1p [Monosporozyma servazzii]
MPWPSEFKQDGLSTNIQDNEDFKCKYITRSDPLGDGNFSVVKECMNIHTKELYAMKMIHKDIIRGKLQLIQREFHLLKYLSQQIRFLEQTGSSDDMVDTFQGHHHILQLFDYFETTANIVLITQLCHKDDLYEKIISNQHLDLIKQVKPYTACLISALDFLHSQNVVHRDIKAENILFRLNKNISINDNNSQTHDPYDLTAHDLILGDFGLALEIHNTNQGTGTALKEYVGTTSYIAPEIVKCKGIGLMTSHEINSIEPYDTKVDIWALGVLVYFMAMGYTPFDCETDQETLECILNCDYYIDESLIHDPTYKDFWNFIQCCFVKDKTIRRSAKNLKSHPFIKDYFKPIQVLDGNNNSNNNSSNITNNNNNNNNNSSINSSTSRAQFPKLKKNKSLTSLHNFKKPPTRRQSSSLIPRIELKKQLSNNLESLTQPTLKENFSLSNSSISSMHNNINNNNPGHHSNGLTRLTPFTPTTLNTTRDTQQNLAKIRDTLRRTISMTSIKTQNTSGINSSTSTTSINLSNGFSSGDQLTRNSQANSTFFLDPQPPKGSLMNGVFCETPESLSNFNTTPRSSLSLSRQNSQSNDIQSLNSAHSAHSDNNNSNSNYNDINNNDNNNNNNNNDSSDIRKTLSFTNVKKTYFELDFEEDE